MITICTVQEFFGECEQDAMREQHKSAKVQETVQDGIVIVRQ